MEGEYEEGEYEMGRVGLGFTFEVMIQSLPCYARATASIHSSVSGRG